MVYVLAVGTTMSSAFCTSELPVLLQVPPRARLSQRIKTGALLVQRSVYSGKGGLVARILRQVRIHYPVGIRKGEYRAKRFDILASG